MPLPSQAERDDFDQLRLFLTRPARLPRLLDKSDRHLPAGLGLYHRNSSQIGVAAGSKRD